MNPAKVMDTKPMMPVPKGQQLSVDVIIELFQGKFATLGGMPGKSLRLDVGEIIKADLDLPEPGQECAVGFVPQTVLSLGFTLPQNSPAQPLARWLHDLDWIAGVPVANAVAKTLVGLLTV